MFIESLNIENNGYRVLRIKFVNMVPAKRFPHNPIDRHHLPVQSGTEITTSQTLVAL